MHTPSSPGGSAGAGHGEDRLVLSPQQLLDQLKRGFTAKLMPLLADMQAACKTELLAQSDVEGSRGRQADDLTNLAILRREAVSYERRWLESIGKAFEGWPHSDAKGQRLDAYTLISDDQLQSQLIGQPVIESMDRRFDDVLDTIDSRLWSLSAALGGQSRPSNPFSPRVLIESLLGTFPVSECDADLRKRFLHHYVRLAGENLYDVYGWINTQLAEAGHAMSGTSDYGTLAPRPSSAVLGASVESEAAPGRRTESDSEKNLPRRKRMQGEAERGDLLRSWARERRAAATGAAQGEGAVERRALSNDEFFSTLSLQQGNETPEPAAEIEVRAIGPLLRDSLLQGAAGLGLSGDASRLSAEQEDAIDLVDAVLQRLREGSALTPAADGRLVRLAFPYLRLALDDPFLFDEADHPAVVLLSEVIGSWDANADGNEQDAELHAIADDAANAVANDYHGNAAVFDKVLDRLKARIEPLFKRREIAERRAWQSILGRERLHAARNEADAQLKRRLEDRELLPSIAEFLDDQWRQSLIHIWLRDGQDSDRYREALAVADSILQVDFDAGQAKGSVVAEDLFKLQEPLYGCFAACGLDESAANTVLAALVAEVANPDTTRMVRSFTPSVGSDDAVAETGGGKAESPLQVGQVVAHHTPGMPAQWLRVAWISPLSGQHLMVNRQGVRQVVMSPFHIATAIEGGQLRPRPLLGRIEWVLRGLAREAGA